MDEGIDPQDMCRRLYGAMDILDELSADTSGEIVLLFQEWLEAAENECARFLREEPDMSAGDMARRLKLPEETVRLLLLRAKQ